MNIFLDTLHEDGQPMAHFSPAVVESLLTDT
jgi:hypothetical protein